MEKSKIITKEKININEKAIIITKTALKNETRLIKYV